MEEAGRPVPETHQELLSTRDQFRELEQIYSTSPIGLCVIDLQLRFVRLNERMAAMDGLSVEDHIGRTLREVVPEVAEFAEPLCHEVINSGEPALDLELRGVTRVRPEMVGLVNLYPLKSADGRVQAVSVVVQDITERKRADEALQRSEKRLAQILESAMDAIITIDEKRIVTLFNSAAENVLRCSATDALGHSFDRFTPAAFRVMLTRCMGALGRSTRKGYIWAPEGLTAIRADGEEFPVEATISKVELKEQKLLTIILRDVNDRPVLVLPEARAIRELVG